MLKSLELIGFKSFADKTRFDFDAGITAVVGPNGSGKSNIVDSIRWILGEQSPKNLRSKEMADVIFNGSKNRRSLGMAEVSLTLDNHTGFLPFEGEEIVITRRVYRSGEGEYLINGQLVRLRDIREMFMGSGSGGTYNIIAQGRIEMLLQSSTKERRFIFEEAAGISKFRARKLETLRRLDRVDQNLLRAQDIHEELEKQLRSLKVQAGKARRFKEHSDRLGELRLSLGMADFYGYSGRLTEQEGIQEHLRSQVEQTEKLTVESEARLTIVNETLGQKEEALRKALERTAEVREQISAVETQIAANQARNAELAEEIAKVFEQLRVMRSGLADLERRHHQFEQRVESDSVQMQVRTEKLRTQEDQLDRLSEEYDRLNQSFSEVQEQSTRELSNLTRLENEQSGLESQLGLLWQHQERLAEKHKSLDRQVRRIGNDRLELILAEQAVLRQLSRAGSLGSDLQNEHNRFLEQRSDLLEKLANIRDERTSLASRIDVLENLQKRHEGLTGGAKRAVALRASGEEVWRPVLGVLAECLQTGADYADLVELALGHCAQALVVRSQEDLGEELLSAARDLPGRVTLLSLVPPNERLETGGWRLEDPNPNLQPPASSLSGVVECTEEFRPLVDWLLGSTFIAEDYATARRIALKMPGTRIVTRAGDVLEADHTVRTGPLRGTSGILSRTAEIHDTSVRIGQIDERITGLEGELASLEEKVGDSETHLGQNEVLHRTLTEQCRHFEIILGRLTQRCRSLEAEGSTARAELTRTEEEIAQLDRQLCQLEESLVHTHDRIKSSTERRAQLELEVTERQEARESLRTEIRSAKLELAVSGERLGSLEAQATRSASDLHQRKRETGDLRNHLSLTRQRSTEIGRQLLSGRSALAELYSRKEKFSQTGGVDPSQLCELKEERSKLSTTTSEQRKNTGALREKLHATELRITELRLGLETLLSRIQEDYDVNLADLVPEDYQPLEEDEREDARHHIKDLREKISRLGAVNVEALDELGQTEERASSLGVQIDDLTSAKRQLEKVIQRINEESRRLFLETFETVRDHFKDLFRKLFGGGQADMILEDETDVTETGIEIIARPPGKEPRSISLLSGGEKTLTAVALVMALFRSRPSPFCILDEVDAALDEANIGRFLAVLREFLDKSQFLLITHSKTTMSSADVLHGITQRESGVSIRVSVRLDQVAEDGTIKESPEPADAFVEDAG